MIVRSLDPSGDIVIVKAVGALTADMIRRHYDALRTLIAPMRADGRPVRILSDVTEGGAHDPTLEAMVTAEMAKTFRPEDRIAILTATVEDQDRVRALVRAPNIGAFRSRIAAEVWLSSDAPPPGRRPG